MYVYILSGFFVLLFLILWFQEDKPIQVVDMSKKTNIKQEFATLTNKQNIEKAFHGTMDTAKYLGCFAGKKFEAVLSVMNPRMDLKMCQGLARDRNYRYFGLSNGHVCLAGNTLTKLKKSKGCIVKCPGNSNQIGGGQESTSIYRLKGVIPKKTRIEKYKKEDNTGIVYQKKDLLMTVKGSPDFAAKYCNSLAHCKMFIYDEDDSKVARLLSNGQKIVNNLQTLYLK